MNTQAYRIAMALSSLGLQSESWSGAANGVRSMQLLSRFVHDKLISSTLRNSLSLFKVDLTKVSEEELTEALADHETIKLRLNTCALLTLADRRVRDSLVEHVDAVYREVWQIIKSLTPGGLKLFCSFFGPYQDLSGVDWERIEKELKKP